MTVSVGYFSACGCHGIMLSVFPWQAADKNSGNSRGNGNGGSLERKLAVEIRAGSWVPYVGRPNSFNFPHATDLSKGHGPVPPVTIFRLPRPQVFKSHTFLNVLLGGSTDVSRVLYVLALRAKNSIHQAIAA